MSSYIAKYAMIGGLLGTLVQMLLVYGMVPLLTGQPVHLAAMLEPSCAPALLLHLISGSVLFPLGYLSLAPSFWSGSPVLKGMFWGGLLWVTAEIVMAPLLGAGIVSAELGGMAAALRALLGYLVYGATLGGLTGAAEAMADWQRVGWAPAWARQTRPGGHTTRRVR